MLPGLKSYLEIVMRQEKQKPHTPGATVSISAAASHQVRTPTKADGNPAWGVLALGSVSQKNPRNQCQEKKKEETYTKELFLKKTCTENITDRVQQMARKM